MSIGSFPESLSQAILVGIMLVGQLGVLYYRSGVTACYNYNSLLIAISARLCSDIIIIRFFTWPPQDFGSFRGAYSDRIVPAGKVGVGRAGWTRDNYIVYM